MISLSIYCSTQTMSVALYNGQILLDIAKKKITHNKIDCLPLIINKILNSNNTKSLDRILFCRGPGSYTANRSIKALAQGLSLAKNSKLITLDNFELYLGNLEKRYTRSIVFFKDFKDKFFVKIFYKKRDKFVDYEGKFYHVSGRNLTKIIFEKLSAKPNTVIISDHKYYLDKFKKKAESVKYLSPHASHLANSFFNGYGLDNLEIVYHHTYYK